MTDVILFTLGSQSLLERSPKTAEASLFTKRLNMIVTIYYAEEKNMSGCGCGTTKKKGTKAKKQVKKKKKSLP